ncbi:hypothetical protein A2U01_0117248, partial [Trifolium medium]|nr:hypothetical protein [Trifolium medium]
ADARCAVLLCRSGDSSVICARTARRASKWKG